MLARPSNITLYMTALCVSSQCSTLCSFLFCPFIYELLFMSYSWRHDVIIENDYRSSMVASSPRFHLPV
jgi:hypothetical protein